MKKRTRLGLNRELYCSPIFSGLMREEGLDCTFDVVAKNAIKMREHDLDGAFLSPIDYARESSDYCIIPNIAVSSHAPTDTIAIHFKEGLHTISTLAVNPVSTSEIVLASILLNERFTVRPKIVPVVGSLDQMFRSANAALLVGNAALDQVAHQNRIDLVEEWFDLTGLPYIHGFWCVREADVTQHDVLSIRRACELGIGALGGAASVERPEYALSPDTHKQYWEHFSYSLSGEEQDALVEFIRYAYYHGVLSDVADLHFYPAMTEGQSPYADPSLN